MNENPYQSPMADSTPQAITEDVRAEGNHLVVRSGAVLPPFCIKTNEAVEQQDMKQRNFTWCSPLVALLILLSGLLLILVYFIIRKHCTITFGISPTLKRKYRNRLLIKIIAVIVLFVAMPICAAADSGVIAMIALLLFLAAVISLFIGNSPLSITKYRKGEFWVSGCSKEFLARFAG